MWFFFFVVVGWFLVVVVVGLLFVLFSVFSSSVSLEQISSLLILSLGASQWLKCLNTIQAAH